MPPNIEIIAIEGNIGSGKSTILKMVQDMFSAQTNIIFLKEPAGS